MPCTCKNDTEMLKALRKFTINELENRIHSQKLALDSVEHYLRAIIDRTALTQYHSDKDIMEMAMTVIHALRPDDCGGEGKL